MSILRVFPAVLRPSMRVVGIKSIFSLFLEPVRAFVVLTLLLVSTQVAVIVSSIVFEVSVDTIDSREKNPPAESLGTRTDIEYVCCSFCPEPESRGFSIPDIQNPSDVAIATPVAG